MVYPTTPERAWNTWRTDRPAAMVHLPSGFALGVAAFSGRHGRWSLLGPGDGLELGRHELDGSLVELVADVEGTRLAITYRKPDPWTCTGAVRVVDAAELPLRFWVLVWCGFDATGDERGVLRAGAEPPDPLADLVIEGRWRSRHVTLVTADRPVAAGRYADVAEAGSELAERGYVHPPGWEPAGPFVVLRFNAEVTPAVRFAAAQATDAPAARRAAHEALDNQAAAARGSTDSEPAAGAERAAPEEAEVAVRDVLAWNTVWDPVNHRWYTTLSRRWVADRFGGWLMWLNDCLYHALMAARIGDAALAAHNLGAALDAQQPAGNLPCLLSGHTEWVDRSQPPIGAWITWRVHLLTGDPGLLRRAYPVLRRWHDWWFAHRDGDGNGLLEYGTSPTGRGLYVHTHFAARNESSMDNSPMFDDARFDPDRHTLDLEEVGLNSLLALDAEMLARIADALGRADEAALLRERAERQAAAVRERLWDPSRGLFAGRHWDGRFAEHVTPTSFYPLVAGIATPEQAERMVRDWLLDDRRFWGDHPLPASPHDDPASADDAYWRGRVWPPQHLLVHEGLRRYGYDDEARALAERGWALFRGPWEQGRRSMENFHRDDPSANAGPDVDAFYTWGALLPTVLLLDRADANPWAGTCLVPGARLPAGAADLELRRDGEAVVLVAVGAPLVRVAPARPLADVRVAEGCVRFDVPGSPAPCEVTFAGGDPAAVVAWWLDGRPAAGAGERGVKVPASEAPTAVELFLRPPRRHGAAPDD